MEETDLLIVGGGPAGLAAALAASTSGVASVTVLDRRAEWGRPVRCAEFAPSALTRCIGVAPEAIAQRIERIEFLSQGKPLGRLKAPGFVLHRDVFEADLADRADICGVRTALRARIIRIEGSSAWARTPDGVREWRFRYLIGADGPSSIVRASCFGAPMTCAGAIQWTLPAGPAAPRQAEVHLAPEYGAGYAWLFPKLGFVHVGAAVHGARRPQLKALLQDFVWERIAEGRIAAGPMIRRTGGVVPVCGGVWPPTNGNALLCGDAAGHVHPLLGAGIISAISCGQMAGAAVAKALRSGNRKYVDDYARQAQDFYGAYWKRGCAAVNTLESVDPQRYIEAAMTAWGAGLRP